MKIWIATLHWSNEGEYAVHSEIEKIIAVTTTKEAAEELCRRHRDQNISRLTRSNPNQEYEVVDDDDDDSFIKLRVLNKWIVPLNGTFRWSIQSYGV